MLCCSRRLKLIRKLWRRSFTLANDYNSFFWFRWGWDGKRMENLLSQPWNPKIGFRVILPCRTIALLFPFIWMPASVCRIIRRYANWVTLWAPMTSLYDHVPDAVHSRCLFTFYNPVARTQRSITGIIWKAKMLDWSKCMTAGSVYYIL